MAFERFETGFFEQINMSWHTFSNKKCVAFCVLIIYNGRQRTSPKKKEN
jgi:hypothetical protein